MVLLVCRGRTPQRTFMFLLVKNVLTPAEVEQCRQLAKTVRFVDGRISNPHNTAKNNLQADMAGSEEVRNFALPKRIATPLLSRYEPGMTYGVHSDAAYVMAPPAPLRSD